MASKSDMRPHEAPISTASALEGREDSTASRDHAHAGGVALESAEPYRSCPFDARLNRTPYLVIPKLAIQAMPMEWRDRLEALMLEAEAAGIETPEYHVFRDDGEGRTYTRARIVNERTGFVRLVGGREDPWANYRHGSIRALCPKYTGGHR